MPSDIVGLWARTHTPAAGAVPRDHMGVGLSVIRSCALWGLENTATEQCHKHRNPSSRLRITQHQQGQPPGFPALLTEKGKTTKSQRSPALGTLLLVHGCPLLLPTRMEPSLWTQPWGAVPAAWPGPPSHPFFLRLLVGKRPESRGTQAVCPAPYRQGGRGQQFAEKPSSYPLHCVPDPLSLSHSQNRALRFSLCCEHQI